MVEINLGEADFNHLFQTLTGDVCDGFKGCPGIGPKKAGNILGVATDSDGHFFRDVAWDAVVATYEKKGLTEADALVQAQVARICRAEDWDADKREVKLWSPNKETN